MQSIKPALIIVLLATMFGQLTAQDVKKESPKNKTDKTKGNTLAIKLVNAVKTPKEGSAGPVDMVGHTRYGIGKPMFSVFNTRALNTGSGTTDGGLFQPLSMVKLDHSTADESAPKLEVSVTEGADKKQNLSIMGVGLGNLSKELEITEISGEKVLFDKKDVVFDSETGQLQIKLSIEKGFYTFKIPTTSGNITETITLFWK